MHVQNSTVFFEVQVTEKVLICPPTLSAVATNYAGPLLRSIAKTPHHGVNLQVPALRSFSEAVDLGRIGLPFRQCE